MTVAWPSPTAHTITVTWPPHDRHMTIIRPLQETALPGQTLTVRTPHGKVSVVIPPGYAAGDTISFAMPPHPPGAS